MVLVRADICVLAAEARKWKHVPKGVVTFFDMVSSNICTLIEEIERLLGMRETAKKELEQPVFPIRDISDFDSAGFYKVLDKLERACKECGLTGTAEHIVYARYHIQDPKLLTFQLSLHHCEAIYAALIMETARTTFLKLEKSEYYSRIDDPEREKMFGEKTESAFPSAVPEVIGACNCFALEQWTACVFHCMRVLEAPLVALAKKFSVPYDKAEWNTIIEAIEKAVRAIDPAFGLDWKDQQKFYGEAARHFMFIKNSWRNHVMHVRDEYDEGKALSILQHTKELTTHLSERLSEAP
jgi:hypothetical protein